MVFLWICPTEMRRKNMDINKILLILEESIWKWNGKIPFYYFE